MKFGLFLIAILSLISYGLCVSPLTARFDRKGRFPNPESDLVPGYNFPSYSGYFTVNNASNSNMFFWFFPAEKNSASAPLLTWLQGGPGASSMFGLFTENGPFSVAADGTTLIPNPYRWTQNFSMIYIDNPVGVGFSFTDSQSGYVTTEVEVGANMVSLLSQFFTIFPTFRTNDFYVVGESYGGKYTPASAYAIFNANKALPKSQRINLKGMAMGDGLLDPNTQFIGYADLAYWAGIADAFEARVIIEYERRIQEHLRKVILLELIRGLGQAVEAFDQFDEMLNGDFYPYPTYFYNITGSGDYFNLINPIYAPNPYPTFLNQESTRNAIHVGAVPYFDYNSTVEKNLIVDWMFSVKPWVEYLLDNDIKVLVYNGQEDVILSGPQVENTLQSLKWKGANEYRESKKLIWFVEPTDPEVAGYVKHAKNLYQAIVRTAGHMVPADQPRAALDLITRYINGIPFGKPTEFKKS